MLNPFDKYSKIKKIISDLKKLEDKSSRYLHLTANENVLSETARSFKLSELAGRYYFGGGNKGVVKKRALDAIGLLEIEGLLEAAKHAANKRLNSSLICFDLLSGLHAMVTTMLAVSEPQDTVMTLNNKYGGHFMTNSVFDRIGRKQIHTVHIHDSQVIDVSQTVVLFKRSKAKVLYLDMMSVLEKVPLKQLRNGIGKDPVIVYDVSHSLGLIIAGQFQSPLKEGVDIIIGNTHKTFPGPQKAIAAFKDKQFGQKVLNIMRKGLYSSVHTGSLIAVAITMLEMYEFGKDYALQMLDNTKYLASELEKKGYVLRKTSRGEYSQNHQLHILLESASNIMQDLHDNNISATVLNPPGGKSYLRLGTQEITRKGMKQAQMRVIAEILDSVVQGRNIRQKVIDLISSYPNIGYSFDDVL